MPVCKGMDVLLLREAHVALSFLGYGIPGAFVEGGLSQWMRP